MNFLAAPTEVQWILQVEFLFMDSIPLARDRSKELKANKPFQTGVSVQRISRKIASKSVMDINYSALAVEREF